MTSDPMPAHYVGTQKQWDLEQALRPHYVAFAYDDGERTTLDGDFTVEDLRRILDALENP
ncbi:MAG TPA: hypothetical protein PKZ27_02855 [Rhodocyclaceae bacterium]|nr:hypothetical protein [Burkholderiaceae bacterium]HRP74505.1 hypothetical protein [Rhodocyclaceae bacterium]